MSTNPATRARWIAALASSEELLLDLYLAASEVCDDFEDYGPVLQAGDDGEYDESTAIARLKAIRRQLKQRLAASAQAQQG